MQTAKNPRKIPIIILIDVEPDKFFINRSSDNSWHGCEYAFSTLVNVRARLEQATGRPVHYTWLVRADPQIAESYGSPSWIMQTYRKTLEQLQAQGDEIGLHIHAYHWHEEQGHEPQAHWVEDYGNQAWVEECVRMGVSAFQQAYGQLPKVFSTGADWTNQATLQLLDQLGIECDVSIVAGKPKISFPNHLGAYTGTRPDSSAIRPRPYHPSPQDFRMPAPNQEENGLWILPLTSYTVGQHQSWKRKVRQWLQSPFAKRAEARIEKLYLESDVRQLRASLASTLRKNSNEVSSATPDVSKPSYLTMIVGTRAFADEKRRKNIHAVLNFLATHRAAAQFTFTTPLDAIDLLNAQELNVEELNAQEKQGQ